MKAMMLIFLVTLLICCVCQGSDVAGKGSRNDIT